MVSLSSAGTLAVALLGIFQFFIFGFIYLKHRSDEWNGWVAFISFSTVLYSGSLFIQYQTPPLNANILCEKVQYTAILLLIYSAQRYTYTFLRLPGNWFSKINGWWMALVAIAIWLPNLIISNRLVYRNFYLMDRPYVEPELTLPGKLLLAYIIIFTLYLLYVWFKQRRSAGAFLAGILIWIGLGIHDALATTTGLHTIQFLMEYGFLAFMLSVSMQNFHGYVQSEYQYKMIANNVSDTIWKISLEPFRFTYMSPSVQKMLGYTVEESMSMSPVECLSPESLALVNRVLAEKLAEAAQDPSDKDMSVVLEIQQRTKNNDYQWDELTAKFIYNEDNVPVEILGITRDISERKRAEQEKRKLEERLQRAEKMEALGTMAGGVAHDLNNMLGIVVGYAELLLQEVANSSSIKTYALNIMNGGKRAAVIVQDLLILAGRGVPIKQVLNLNKTIIDCQQLPEFEKMLSYHPTVRIHTELDQGLLNIHGSSVHLDKTLLNLVSNACEAMPNGGTLTIKTENQYLEHTVQRYEEIQAGEYVVLSVSDAGKGIPAADLKHIFEPFYTKKVMGRSGTGLGLAVVWTTLKDHHGYIDVQCEEGKGSAFLLYFPTSREEISSEAVAISLSEYMGKGESILVVDDVQGQRDLATEMLRKLNYNAQCVSSGEEAVAYLKEHPVDLVVLDMIMDPGMDGLDTFESVLKIHPQQKAIIVSGFTETDRVSKASDLGACTYVKKPYVMENLGLAVRKELDRK